jgi:hypothetical protein
MHGWSSYKQKASHRKNPVTGDKVVLAARYLRIYPQMLCFNERARQMNQKATGT